MVKALSQGAYITDTAIAKMPELDYIDVGNNVTLFKIAVALGQIKLPVNPLVLFGYVHEGGEEQVLAYVQIDPPRVDHQGRPRTTLRIVCDNSLEHIFEPVNLSLDPSNQRYEAQVMVGYMLDILLARRRVVDVDGLEVNGLEPKWLRDDWVGEATRRLSVDSFFQNLDSCPWFLDRILER
jgi:hypothetical protein